MKVGYISSLIHRNAISGTFIAACYVLYSNIKLKLASLKFSRFENNRNLVACCSDYFEVKWVYLEVIF